MITQAIDQTRIPSRRRRFVAPSIGFIAGFGLSLGLGLVPGAESPAQAGRMLTSATNAPLKYPTYLNGRGRVLSQSSTTHALADRDKAKAAYVAFKLRDGADLSQTVPVMRARSPVGPAVRQTMTAISSGSGKIAVRTQKGLFLVGKYRPKLAAAPHRKAAVKHRGGGGARKAAPSHIAVKAQPQRLAGAGARASSRVASSAVAAQSAQASSPVGSSLKLDPPKSSPATTHDDYGNPLPDPLHVTNPTPSLSASGLSTSSLSASGPSTSGLMLDSGAGSLGSSPAPREAPVPEPGTLVFAGLAIGGAVLRAGLQRRRDAR